MSTRQPKALGALLVVVLATLLQLPAFGASAVIGSVAGGGNATVSGVAILPNTTLYSGDSLQVLDGVAYVSTDRSGSLTFGQDTQASFLRESDQVTVVLTVGSVTMQHAAESSPISIKAGDLLVVPSQGVSTEAEFAREGHTLVVTLKEGSCRVMARGQSVEISKGQTAALRASAEPGPVGPANDMVVKVGATPPEGAGSVAAFLASGGSNNLTNPANAANLRAGDQAELAAAVARIYHQGDDGGGNGFGNGGGNGFGNGYGHGHEGCRHKASEYEPPHGHCKCEDDHDHDKDCKHHHGHDQDHGD